MSTITKESAQQIFLGNGPEPTASEERELARIALASLEAEPAIHRWRRVTAEPYGPYPWHYGNFICFSKPVDGIEDEYYYAAPPAPVSVPAAMEMDDDFDSAFEHGKAVGWNAYRAAMLQGAEPVQGWITCSDRMPTKNDRVLIFINFNSDTVPPSIHDAQFTGSTFRRGNATVNVFPLEDGYGVTHWMPLPAAPQQEA